MEKKFCISDLEFPQLCLKIPGHVQTQNILRGARRNSSSGGGSGGGHDPSLSTGIPALDLAQQSGRENSSNQSAHRRNLQEQDEFAGLMNQRERQWVINIQLNQVCVVHSFRSIDKSSLFENICKVQIQGFLG